jgi:Ca2+-binding EF-hand superfamily protein
MSKPSEDQLRQAIDAVFNKYDTDKSNTLDNSELKNVIRDTFGQLGAHREVTDEDIKKFLGAVDRNSDGKVTKIELLEIFKRLTGSI